MDSPENWSPEVCEFFGLFKICGIYFGIAMLPSVIVTRDWPERQNDDVSHQFTAIRLQYF